ncbi:SIMPL domain-containing protein [Streptomyces sp. NPDC052114]|uniref:SIMPL domain-containing protein n=1 Tax=unclassified Streptomyces TaxID=2593676 RepID=UPI00343258A0
MRPVRPARPVRAGAVGPVRAVGAVVVALAALGLPAAPALAAAPAPAVPAAAPAPAPAPTTVTVTGVGSASAVPDLAVLTAGVEVTRPTAEKALAAQNTAAKALLAAARGAGVAERDIRTENLALSAVYRDEDDTSKVTGYQASQVFTLKVRAIGRTGAVIQAVMDAAGDAGRIHAVAFDLADPGALRARARDAAYADARGKAAQYAKLAGRRLGRLVSLDESDGGRPRPVAMPVAAAKEDVPLAPGEIQDEVSVTAVYALR